MEVVNHLSSSLERKDQEPNKALAQKILDSRDVDAIKSLIAIIQNPLSLDLLGDALKVLESIGMENSELVTSAFKVLLPLLEHKQNKIQWRVMSALSPIAVHFPKETYAALSTILMVMDKGSVITRDHGFKILISLYEVPSYRETLRELILEQLQIAPDNQLGQYAEKWFEVIQPKDIADMQKILTSRSQDLSSPSHQKRIYRLLLKVQKSHNL